MAISKNLCEAMRGPGALHPAPARLGTRARVRPPVRGLYGPRPLCASNVAARDRPHLSGYSDLPRLVPATPLLAADQPSTSNTRNTPGAINPKSRFSNRPI